MTTREEDAQLTEAQPRDRGVIVQVGSAPACLAGAAGVALARG